MAAANPTDADIAAIMAQQYPWLFVNPIDYCQKQPVLELTYFCLVLSCIGLFVNFCWTSGLILLRDKLYDSGGGVTQYVLFVALGVADMIWSLAIVFHILRILPYVCNKDYFVTGPLSNIFPTQKGQEFCRESDIQYYVFLTATIFQPTVVVTMAVFRYLLTVWQKTLKTWQCLSAIFLIQIPFIVLLERLHDNGAENAIICTWFAQVPSPRYDDKEHDKDVFRWLWLLCVFISIVVSGLCYQRVWAYYSNVSYSVEKTVNMKLFWLLLTVWCFFMFCWIPTGLFLFLTLGNHVELADDATFFWYVTVFILTQVHSIGDPILICAMGSRYRSALKGGLQSTLGRLSQFRILSSSSFGLGSFHDAPSNSLGRAFSDEVHDEERIPMSPHSDSKEVIDSLSWNVTDIRTAMGESLENESNSNHISSGFSEDITTSITEEDTICIKDIKSQGSTLN